MAVCATSPSAKPYIHEESQQRSGLGSSRLHDGVTVVKWLRTHHVPWSSIERLGYDGDLWIRCRNTREIPAAAIAFFPGANSIRPAA
jgi:hypothetical protein